MTQKVFQGGSIWSSIQAAKHAMEAARDMRTDQEQEVVLRTRQAYLGALLADRSVTIARLTYEQAETERQRVELRQGTGEASEFDLLQAQLQSENQIPVIKRAESFRVIAYLELRRLANIPPSQPMVLTSTVLASERVLDAAATVDTTGLVDDALRSASVRALQEQVEARRHAVTVAASDKWPELNLFANYSKQAFPSDVFPTASDEWLNDVNAGVRVNWALFDGFRTKGAIQESKARRIAAQLNLQQAREQVREAIVQSRGELDRAASDLRARTATVRVAERAHELARLRFEEGASSMIELNDARISLEIAQTNEAQARHDFFVALARLERYSGRPLFASLVSTIEGTR
ncbi:MAG: TolC family protein [Candidatus Eisenbacteria bacterium]|nr:TolC family protein [Candidatus Eisenbacteria bacterium]